MMNEWVQDDPSKWNAIAKGEEADLITLADDYGLNLEDLVVARDVLIVLDNMVVDRIREVIGHQWGWRGLPLDKR